ncbi:hypothetical protein CXF72_15125 [Psychromonas sp. MB-3u-54]|nr:hypothetical protein CXF72_15125 [Psychromonas sp. MB-3u-54]
MHALSVNDGYLFIEGELKLIFQPDVSLFQLSSIKKAHDFLKFLKRNKVTVLQLEIDKLQTLDSNCESFIYQIGCYFAKEKQSSFLIQADGDNEIQNNLIRNLLVITPAAKVTFVIN